MLPTSATSMTVSRAPRSAPWRCCSPCATACASAWVRTAATCSRNLPLAAAGAIGATGLTGGEFERTVPAASGPAFALLAGRVSVLWLQLLAAGARGGASGSALMEGVVHPTAAFAASRGGAAEADTPPPNQPVDWLTTGLDGLELSDVA